MNLAEASVQMTISWKKMVDGPGLKSYHGLDGGRFNRIREALVEGRVPKDVANLPAINDRVISKNSNQNITS